MSQKLTWEQFKALKEVKHNADVAIDDIIYLDDTNGFHVEEKTFDKAIVYGYCGDEYFARIEQTGHKTGFTFRGDMYKIVGKQISTNQK
jgi:hypothetical protein